MEAFEYENSRKLWNLRKTSFETPYFCRNDWCQILSSSISDPGDLLLVEKDRGSHSESTSSHIFCGERLLVCAIIFIIWEAKYSSQMERFFYAIAANCVHVSERDFLSPTRSKFAVNATEIVRFPKTIEFVFFWKRCVFRKKTWIFFQNRWRWKICSRMRIKW